MIELKNITKTYTTGKVEVRALNNLSLQVFPGEFVAIMGPSGSGKSTLLHILGFLDRPDSGSYFLAGKDITQLTDNQLAVLRNRIAGFVFQQFHLLPRISALENAALPLVYAGKRDLRKAEEKISQVRLSHRANHRPNELSGGEQQRVAIARSLVNDPLIILADEPTGNLDSKSEGEIVSILKELHKQGKTIIMVTHEKEIADHAERIIYMRDGKIISDSGSKRESVSPENVSLEEIVSQSTRTNIWTEFTAHLRQAVYAILSHKMRSVLSMLGILIGVSAVIAMLALGQGAKESIAQRLASLGSNLLTVRPGSHRTGHVALEAGTVTRFTLQDAEAISRLPEVRRVSPSVSGRGQVVFGNRNWNTRIQGTGADYAEMRASIPVEGRFFTDEEIRIRRKVALLGKTLVKELFAESNPVGSTIKINRINFEVIGVLPEKGATGWRDEDDIVIIPITTAMYRVLGKEYIDTIDVEVKDASLIEQAQESISELIIQRHRLRNKESQESFEIRNMSEIQEAIQSTSRTMTWLLGSIAAISLLVGGIGIMNIMLVSVTERTREIGLRKAIGARNADIMFQFLIESIVLTFIGALLGIVFGSAVSRLLSLLAGWTTKVSFTSIIIATTFSVAVGIGFGLWPAREAARLNPIEALRYE